MTKTFLLISTGLGGSAMAFMNRHSGLFGGFGRSGFPLGARGAGGGGGGGAPVEYFPALQRGNVLLVNSEQDPPTNLATGEPLTAATLDPLNARFGSSGLTEGVYEKGLVIPAGEDFTVELFVNPLVWNIDLNQHGRLLGAGGSSPYAYLDAGYISSQNKLSFAMSVNDGTTGFKNLFFSLPTGIDYSGTWFHLAFSRQGDETRLFVDGVSQRSDTSMEDVLFDFRDNELGTVPMGSPNYSVDNIRVHRGSAIRWANFTPSDDLPVPVALRAPVLHPDDVLVSDFAQFPAVNYVDGNTWFDVDYNTEGPVPNGRSIQPLISVSARGGIDTPVSVAANQDFSFEAWVRVFDDPVSGNYTVFQRNPVGGSGNSVQNTNPQLLIGWGANFSNRFIFRFTNAENGLDAIAADPDTLAGRETEWNHVAVSRQGSVMKIWENGGLVSTESGSLFTMALEFFGIPEGVGFRTGAFPKEVQFTNLRFRVGSTIYWDGNFTPGDFEREPEPFIDSSGSELGDATVITDTDFSEFASNADLETSPLWIRQFGTFSEPNSFVVEAATDKLLMQPSADGRMIHYTLDAVHGANQRAYLEIDGAATGGSKSVYLWLRMTGLSSTTFPTDCYYINYNLVNRQIKLYERGVGGSTQSEIGSYDTPAQFSGQRVEIQAVELADATHEIIVRLQLVSGGPLLDVITVNVGSVDIQPSGAMGFAYFTTVAAEPTRLSGMGFFDGDFALVEDTGPPVIDDPFTAGSGIGWDENVDASILANAVLTDSDNIQAAVDVAHAANQPYIIALRGGTYRQSVTIPSGATGITLKRYGSERPILTGAEPLTGWAQATVADEPVLGAAYASVYRTTIPVASVPHDTPRLLNLHHNGEQRYIAQDVLGYVDPVTGQVEANDRAYIKFDSNFHETDVTYTYNGSNVITAITSQSVFGAYTQAQLEGDGVLLSVYCADNRVELATITSYNPATFTAQVSSPSASFVQATNLREAFSIVNLPAALGDGHWSALRDGADFVIYYRPLAGESAGLDAAMEYSVRGLGIDLGGCTDLTLRGLDIVQYETSSSLSATGIGSSTSGRRAEAKTNLTIEHCRLGQSSGADYGALLVAGSTGARLRRITLENIDGYGGFLRDSADMISLGVHTRRCGQSGLRVFTVDKGLFADMLFEENGRGGHANQLNFYEGCDDIAVAFLETRNCFGYVTHQEASNVTYYMSSIMVNREDGSSGRGIADQNREAGAGQGGPDGSGAPVADSDFRYICLDLIPYSFSGTNSLSVGGGAGTSERSIILNNLLHGGGHPDVYTDARNPLLEVRDGNIYTGLSFWQNGGFGWSPETNEVVTNTDAVFADLTGRDLRHRVGSPVRGAVGVDITTHVEALEALWPGVDFRRDLAGNVINPATPPVGALSDRGAIPLFAPSTMAAPTLGTITDDGLTVTLASAPDDNGSAITSYDLQYRVDAGAWVLMEGVSASTVLSGLGSGVDVDVQNRAVNAIGAGEWSVSASATTTVAPAGLPDGIMPDPTFLNVPIWDVVSGSSVGAGANVDGTVNTFSTAFQNDNDDLFAFPPSTTHELSFSISRFVNTGTSRLRFTIDYTDGSTASTSNVLGNSGNIGGSTITITGTGEYGPFTIPAAPAGTTHARIKILVMNADMDLTIGKVSIVPV